MIRTSSGDFEVELFKEDYSHHSVDNINHYDFFYSSENAGYTTQIGIRTFKDDALLKSALISAGGGGTGIHKTSFICEEDRIVLCCSDSVFCLSIPQLNLLWSTKADFATCFQIFSLGTDYIVHGELEITRLGKDGNIIWQRGGADIFTTINFNEDNFSVGNGFILVTDWGNRKYIFDFDGNLIE